LDQEAFAVQIYRDIALLDFRTQLPHKSTLGLHDGYDRRDRFGLTLLRRELLFEVLQVTLHFRQRLSLPLALLLQRGNLGVALIGFGRFNRLSGVPIFIPTVTADRVLGTPCRNE
jgi:hypothetical protein